MKKEIIISVLLIAFLSGCASKKVNTQLDIQQTIDQKILDSSILIQNQQTALFEAGALNQITLKPKALATQENIYTVVWYGDAMQLLTKLAHDQKMNFKYTGIRLPLPVAIKSVDVPLSEALKTIQAQISHKTNMVVKGNTIEVNFNEQKW